MTTTTLTLVVGFVLGIWDVPRVEATTTTSPATPQNIHLSPGVKAGIGLSITATVILSIWCCCIGPWHWSRRRRQQQRRRQAQDHNPGFNGCQLNANENDTGKFKGRSGSDSDLEGRDMAIVAGKLGGEVRPRVSEIGVDKTGRGMGGDGIVSEMLVGSDVGMQRDGRNVLGVEAEGEVGVGVPPPAYRP